MSKSYRAKYIDEEYRREQAFKKAKRQPCKAKNCSECEFVNICKEKTTDTYLNSLVEKYIRNMRGKTDE